MANISQYLTAIKNAIFGEEVRGSIHDAIEVMNDELDTAITDIRGSIAELETVTDELDTAMTEIRDSINLINNELDNIVATKEYVQEMIVLAGESDIKNLFN